jgi:hypothetical protein
MHEVKATFDDGSVLTLFSFYPDKLSFTEQEFIGLTEQEAHQLKFNKDKAYIQN